MKRWFYYILLLCLASACQPEIHSVDSDEFDSSLEGKPVTVSFSLPNVRIAPPTKSIEDGDGNITGEPYLDPDKLYLVVCGGTQGIKYLRKANIVLDPNTHEPVTRTIASLSSEELAQFNTDYPVEYGAEEVLFYDFTVQLELSSEPRTIYFLGNIDENQLDAGSYSYLILPELLSYEGKQAYWQKVYLEHGIKALKDENTDEYVIDDATGSYLPDTQTTRDLEFIPLIRNYAKIQIINLATNFELHSYALIYYPKQGSVSPYRHELSFDPKHPDAGFSFNSTTRFSGYEKCSFNDLDKILGYSGNLPSKLDNMDKNVPTDEMFRNLTESSDRIILYDKDNPEQQGFVMYERGVPTTVQDPTFIILRGRIIDEEHPDDQTYYYYRLDLMETKQDGDDVVSKYYPVYRNFSYSIELYNVASEGVLTPELAVESSGADNISADVTMRHLGDISNGIRRLVVEPFMAKTYTGHRSVPEELYVRFYDLYSDRTPNVEDGDVFVEIEPVEGMEDILYLIDDNGNEVGSGVYLYPKAVDLGTEAEPDPGYRIIRFNLRDPGPESRTQKIKITGWKRHPTPDPEKLSLYREVEITLQGKQTMQVLCTEKELSLRSGSEQTIKITIPTGLTSSMFPLNFIIEAEDNTLTPVPGTAPKNNLPVRSGTSIITEDASPGNSRIGKTTFQFIRTLTYSEYQSLTDGTFECCFKSNRSESATTVWVKDENDYFFLASDSFTNKVEPARPYFYVKNEGGENCYVRLNGSSTLEYSKNSVFDWQLYTGPVLLEPTETVSFRDTKTAWNEPQNSSLFFCYSANNSHTAKDGIFSVGGYLASLILGEDFEAKGENTTAQYTFVGFFKNHANLINAEDLVISMKKCNKDECYKSFFEGCTGLQKAPAKLPATTLSTRCYRNMFYGCKSLKRAPELVATTINTTCYERMFYGCEKLEYIKMYAENYTKNPFISSRNGDNGASWVQGVTEAANNGEIWLSQKLFGTNNVNEDGIKTNIVPHGPGWQWTIHLITEP